MAVAYPEPIHSPMTQPVTIRSQALHENAEGLSTDIELQRNQTPHVRARLGG